MTIIDALNRPSARHHSPAAPVRPRLSFCPIHRRPLCPARPVTSDGRCALAQRRCHNPRSTATELETLMDVGRAPVDLALKPDGGEIFVSNSLSDSVSEIYNTTDEVGDTYMIGNNPVRGIGLARQLAALRGQPRSQEVTVYSIDDGKRIGAVSRWRRPVAMAFSAAGHLLFVADQPLRRRRRGAHFNAIAVYHASGRPQSQRHRRQSIHRAVIEIGPHRLEIEMVRPCRLRNTSLGAGLCIRARPGYPRSAWVACRKRRRVNVAFRPRGMLSRKIAARKMGMPQPPLRCYARARGRRIRCRSQFRPHQNSIIERGGHKPVAGCANEDDVVACLPPIPGHGFRVNGVHLVARARADQDPLRLRVVTQIVNVAERKAMNPHPRLPRSRLR